MTPPTLHCQPMRMWRTATALHFRRDITTDTCTVLALGRRLQVERGWEYGGGGGESSTGGDAAARASHLDYYFRCVPCTMYALVHAS